jgi:hypothetical protein
MWGRLWAGPFTKMNSWSVKKVNYDTVVLSDNVYGLLNLQVDFEIKYK